MKLSKSDPLHLVQPLQSDSSLPFPIDPDLAERIAKPTHPESPTELPHEAQPQQSTRAQRCQEIQARMLRNRNMLNADGNSDAAPRRNIF